jgi:hypothetical protein
MDACDPGTESGNIRRLIKLHTGKIIKSQGVRNHESGERKSFSFTPSRSHKR